MGVYIKGMEMPKMPDSIGQGEKIPYIDVRIFADGDAVVSKGTRPYYDKYAAVELPPHGRLIDADALHEELYALEYARENEWLDGAREARGVDAARVALLDAPTIIEAEEGE